MAKTEKKIFLDRKDGVERAVEEIRRAKAARVVLVVPKGAELGSMVGNFHRLNREAEMLGRELVIESVDDHVLELASLASVPAVNPVFQRRERAMVDIIPRAHRKTEMEPQGSEETREDEETPREERRFSKRSHRSGFKKFLIAIFVLIAVCGAGWFVLFQMLPKVTITLELKKIPVDFSYSVVASIKTKQESISGNTLSLPGELFITPHQNLSMSFTAHGTSTISTKATGKLIAWNAYGKESQAIVVNTRFESPDHKIFRLNKKVTIPGAKIVNGKLTPSSIEVDVTADEPGDEYNIGPATGWKIPGFEGTPKYDGFYAESKMAMTGGSSGERFVATPDDLVSAKQKIEQSLKDALQNQILVLLDDKFKLLPEAVSYTILDENTIPSDKNDGTFTMFAEGEMKYFVFEESAIASTSAASATTTIEGKVHKDDFQISYGSSTVDFAGGVLRVPVIGSFTLAPDLDEEKLKTEIAGENEETLRSVILGIPGVLKANVKFWPFWVSHVPENANKVEIVVK